MPHARFSFEGDLPLFLPPSLRGREVERFWSETDTLMHVVESIGVPHTEVERIEQNGDLIRVYPRHPERLPDPRFILDQHLGRLAAYLRMLGMDVLHTTPAPDEELAAVSSSEDRILLTRDVGLLKRKEVRHGYFVRATDPRTQLSEVVKRFCLVGAIAPFTRCFLCNTRLEHVDRVAIAHRIPEHTADLPTDFKRCPTCARVYWKGSHYYRMRALIDRIKKEAIR
jgi:uncharacterized protein with PIN domain